MCLLIRCTDVFVKKAEKSSTAHSTKGPAESPSQHNTAQEECDQELECEHTQDSFVDDSGFLPSTPPAKKVQAHRDAVVVINT